MKLKALWNPKYLLSALACILMCAHSASATTLAKWTFDTLTLSTANTNATPTGWCTNIPPDIGAGSASGFHARAATAVYSTPAGNGSAKSLSSNNWTNNPTSDFYQFVVSTLTYESISVSYDQIGSGTGPRDFSFQYSTDGVTFTPFTNYSLTAITWSASTPVTTSTYVFDLSAVTALNDVPTVWFRVACVSTNAINGTGPIQGAGTDRIDNFAVLGSTPGPAIIVTDPSSTNVNYGANVSLSAVVNGTSPIYYQWYYFTNGSTTTNTLMDGPSGYGAGTISGSTNSILTLNLVDTNQAGNYFLVVTNAINPPATSQVAQLTVTIRPPIVTNIAYLHTLHNANYALTDTTNLYQVEGIVTTTGDLVNSGGQSAYFQDTTGSGMDLFFFTGTASYALPNIGDHIRVTGQLSQFNGALEIQLTSDPANKLEVLDSGNPLPTPRPFDFSTGINPNVMEGYITNGNTIVPAIEGSYVIVSNVFLGITNSGGAVSADQTIFMTNLTGQVFTMRVPNNPVAQTTFTTLPGTFAKSVRGAMAQFQTSGTVLTNSYGIYYDLQSNIEVGTPPVILVSPKINTITLTSDGVVISGTNNNGTTAGNYAILTSTNLLLPASSWSPVSTQAYNADGTLSFTNPVGTNAQQFYILQALP